MYCGVPMMVPSVVSTWVSVSSVGPGLAADFAKPKIEHLDAIPRQHDVLRLHVPMSNSGAMRTVERVGDLGGVFDGLVERDGAFFNALGEGFAIDQFHHHVAGTDVVKDADMGMVQRRDRPGFAFETQAMILTSGNVFRQDLDGDGAIKTSIAGFVDLAHTARPDRGEDFVRAEFFAGG